MAAVQRALLLATVLRAGAEPGPRLPGLVLHRPPAEAHRAQRRGHRRRRPRRQGARSTVEDEIGQLGRHLQHHGGAPARRVRRRGVRARPHRDAAQRPQRGRHRRVAADGSLTIANPAAAELLGAPLRSAPAIDEAFPADVADLWRESRTRRRRGRSSFEHGDRTLEATTYPVGGEADFTSIVVLRDVTAQARLERARRDLIANASHEFKTPLFSLAGFLELIDEGDLSPEEQQEFLQLMREQVDRLRNLAVSMLDLSRVEAGSVELRPSSRPGRRWRARCWTSSRPQAQART